MAKEALAVVGDAATDTKKRRAPEGPRKIKPLHVALRVTDAQGNPVPNAKVDVVHVAKDFEEVYAHIEGDGTLSRVRIPLDTKTA